MARIFDCHRKSTLALRQRKALLLRQLLPPHNLIRASCVEQFLTCGKLTCVCHQGQKHGPYFYLTQCLALGKLRKFLLKTPTQQEQARRATSSYRQFLEQVEELSQINTELLRRREPLLPEP